jgi:ribonuclease P protein component
VAPLGRLPAGNDFEAVFREGGSIQGPLFLVRFRKRASGDARWGFAVGKKLDRRATVRNRLRRRLREAARATPASSADIVVVARPRLADAPFPRVTAELDRMLRAAGLREGESA